MRSSCREDHAPFEGRPDFAGARGLAAAWDMVLDPYVQNETNYRLILDIAPTGPFSRLTKRVALTPWLKRLIRWACVTKGGKWPIAAVSAMRPNEQETTAPCTAAVRALRPGAWPARSG